MYKLEAEGTLTAKTEVVEDRARKYYSIVQDPQGNAVNSLAQIENFLYQLQHILSPGDIIRRPTT